MKALILILAVLVPAAAVAQVTVSTVSGTVVQDSTLAITGTGFGTKTQAAPLKWDDFQTGTNGDIISPGETYPWGLFCDDGGSGSEYPDSMVYYDNDDYVRFTGDQCAHAVFGRRSASVPHIAQNTLSVDYISVDMGDRIYLHGYYYMVQSGELARNAKMWFLASPGNQWSDPSSRLDFYPRTNSGHAYYENCNAGQQADGDIYGYTDDYMGVNSGQFHRFELDFRRGDYGASTGYMRSSVDGNYPDTAENQAEPAAGCDPYVALNIMSYWDWSSGPSSPFGTADVYWSEIYFDNTLQRVELGDDINWADCTHFEIQIPTEWTDTSISVTVNAGTYSAAAKDAAFLYVYDEDGNVNATGHPVTFGLTEETQAITSPPTNVVVSGGN